MNPERYVWHAVVTAACCVAVQVITETNTEQRVRAERMTCPRFDGALELQSTTTYPSGAATCRYGSLRRGLQREVLLVPEIHFTPM